MKYRVQGANDWELLFRALEASKRESTRYHEQLEASRVTVAPEREYTPEQIAAVRAFFGEEANG